MLSIRPSPSCSAVLRQHTRTYVVSIKPPKVYDHKSVPRVYSEKKTFLYHQYLRLFENNAHAPLIFLQHDKFSVPNLIKIRREVAAAALKHVSAPPSLANPGPNPVPAEPSALPTLTVIRTSLFGVALRDFAPIDAAASADIARTVERGLMVLTLPNLNPPQLNAILRALDRAVPKKRAPTPAELAEKTKQKNADPPNPGRRIKRSRPVHSPELAVMGALIEGRVFKTDGVVNVAKLPTLDTLRAQIIGLLSSPATQLAGVLSQASGGKLARTLEGLKKGLEEEQGSAAEAS